MGEGEELCAYRVSKSELLCGWLRRINIIVFCWWVSIEMMTPVMMMMGEVRAGIIYIIKASNSCACQVEEAKCVL